MVHSGVLFGQWMVYWMMAGVLCVSVVDGVNMQGTLERRLKTVLKDGGGKRAGNMAKG
jgi:hypothetical protein